MTVRLFIAILFVLFAVMLESWLAFFGVGVSVLLAVLVTASFFFNVLEVVLLGLIGGFLMNSAPGWSAEIGFLIALPLLTLAFRHATQYVPWIGVVLAVAVSIVVFYLVIAPRYFWAAPLLGLDLVGSAIIASVAFAVFDGFAAV